MYKISIIIIFCLISIANTAYSQADSVKKYLISALDMMKVKSVNKGKVNWDSLYNSSIKSAATCKTIRDTYPIITDALKGLEDAHSRFYAPEIVKEYLLGYRATGQEFPVIKADFLENKYAYVTLPEIGSYNFDDWNEYVDTFYKRLTELQKHNPKGWILDLRDNIGGMFYPMYAAISPLLNDQKVIATKDAKGEITYFAYKNGKFYEGKNLAHQFNLKNKGISTVTRPLVILINKKTGSSGEFAAISFAGQKNVKFIGENTQGLTSGNQEYKLSDGAFLVLTIGNTVDRNQKEYTKIGEGLSPDFKIETSGKQAETNRLYMSKAIEVLNTSK